MAEDDVLVVQIDGPDHPLWTSFVRLLSRAFCGTTSANPEAAMHWVLTGKYVARACLAPTTERL